MNPSKANLVKGLMPYPVGGERIYGRLGIKKDTSTVYDLVILGQAKGLLQTLKENGYDLAEEAIEDLNSVVND